MIGQLGLGNYDPHNKPVLMMKDVSITSICCGENHTLILNEKGELLSWGCNMFGQ